MNPSVIKRDDTSSFATDTLAERLRRRSAKPMGSPRVGSNPTGVDLMFIRIQKMGCIRVVLTFPFQLYTPAAGAKSRQRGAFNNAMHLPRYMVAGPMLLIKVASKFYAKAKADSTRRCSQAVLPVQLPELS